MAESGFDKRVGQRFKKRREELNYTQEQLAEMMGVSTNYISTIERGATFPRYDKLIRLLNTLQTSADAMFCDVLDYAVESKASVISEKMAKLTVEDQRSLTEIMEFLINQSLKKYSA